MNTSGPRHFYNWKAFFITVSVSSFVMGLIRLLNSPWFNFSGLSESRNISISFRFFQVSAVQVLKLELC